MGDRGYSLFLSSWDSDFMLKGEETKHFKLDACHKKITFIIEKLNDFKARGSISVQK